MVRWNAIWSVFWRNLQSYFSGVLGYLVIVVFVTVAAFCAFSPRFFANNLANLDQLSIMFPMLLLAVVPAITMATWAEEKKQGTDEILFTLPATDFEILLGKYLSVLGIYTIVLAFSLTQLIALAWIGNPDWGVVFTSYLGYWLAGAALLSVGMFASVLTGNTTVAYVLGATFCAIPVLIGQIAPASNFMQGLSLASQLREFTSGLIPLSGIIYFVGLTIIMLYLNLIFISKRHWAAGQKTTMGLQFAARALAIAVSVACLSFMASKSTASFVTRIDATEEGLFTLSPATRETIKQAIANESTVTVQAFVSPDVPREFVHQQKRFDGLLRQYDRIGKGNIDVRFVSVQPNSKEATEAKTAGIKPLRHKGEIAGKIVEQDVYMGAVITSNRDEVVIPFFEAGDSMEYELTRSLATVTKEDVRIKVGILETDIMRMKEAGMFRSFDDLLQRLDQQYKIINIPSSRLSEMLADDLADAKSDDVEEPKSDEEKKAEATKSEEELKKDREEKEKQKAKEKEEREKRQKSRPDVLLVFQPSSLTRPTIDDLTEYIEKGNPAILLVDPVPFYPFTSYLPLDLGIVNSPSQERYEPGTFIPWLTIAPEMEPPQEIQMQLMMMQQQMQMQRMPPQQIQMQMQQFMAEHPEARPRYEPKGDMSRLLKTLGIEWNKRSVVVDLENPHPDFSIHWQKEDGLGSRWPKGYGPKENLHLFVTEREAGKAFSVEDPITNGLREMFFIYAGSIRPASSSKTEFIPLIRTSENSGTKSWDDITEETVTERGFEAVQLKEFASVKPDDDQYVIAARVKPKDEKSKVNAVFVADFDFLSDLYFKSESERGFTFDNVKFLFNSIEVLAGDSSFAALRNRRPQPHRLDMIQESIDTFRRERSTEQTKAEEEMAKKLKDAQKRLENATKEIDENKDLGILQKMQLGGMEADNEQRRFNMESKELQEKLDEKIEALKAEEQNGIKLLENRTRMFAVLLPALPALLLGMIVLVIRFTGERAGVDSRRRK